MKKEFYFFLLIVQLIYSTTTFSKEISTTITIATEPFLFQTEKIGENKIGGLAGKIITESLKNTGIKFQILWTPWKRAQIETLNNTNNSTFIIPLTRNKARELHYKWVAHIYNRETSFFTLKNEPIINDFEGAKNKKIGVLEGSSHETILKDAQLEYEATTLDESNVKKLISKKIDAWYTYNTTGFSAFKINKLNPSKFSIGKPIESEEIYIATGKNTSQDLVDKVKNAIETFKKTPRYKTLIEESFEK